LLFYFIDKGERLPPSRARRVNLIHLVCLICLPVQLLTTACRGWAISTNSGETDHILFSWCDSGVQAIHAVVAVGLPLVSALMDLLVRSLWLLYCYAWTYWKIDFAFKGLFPASRFCLCFAILIFRLPYNPN